MADPDDDAVQTACLRQQRHAKTLVDDHNRDVGIGASAIDLKSEVPPPPPLANCGVLVLVLRPNADAARAGDVLSHAQVADLEAIAREAKAVCTFTAHALEPFTMRGMPPALHARLAPDAVAVAAAARPRCVVIVGERTAEAVYAGCGWGDPPMPGVLDRPKKSTLAVVTVPSIELFRDPSQADEVRRVWAVVFAQPRPAARPRLFDRPAARLGDQPPTKRARALTDT